MHRKKKCILANCKIQICHPSCSHHQKNSNNTHLKYIFKRPRALKVNTFQTKSVSTAHLAALLAPQQQVVQHAGLITLLWQIKNAVVILERSVTMGKSVYCALLDSFKINLIKNAKTVHLTARFVALEHNVLSAHQITLFLLMVLVAVNFLFKL
jgi:hypothetical protein